MLPVAITGLAEKLCDQAKLDEAAELPPSVIVSVAPELSASVKKVGLTDVDLIVMTDPDEVAETPIAERFESAFMLLVKWVAIDVVESQEL